MTDVTSYKDSHEFEVSSVENIEPWAIYDKYREKGSVHWDPVMGAWVILDHEACLEVVMHEDRFRNPYSGAPQVVIDIKGGGRNITVLSGEEHRKMRRFIMKLMIPAKIAEYTKAAIEPVVEFLMDRVLAKGTGKADLVTEFGDQIPSRVIAALLGMDWRDDELVGKIVRLHQEIMVVIGSGFRTEEIRQEGLRLSREINEMLLVYIRDRRENPQNDFISHIWADAPTDLEGGALMEEDVVAICREIFLGGADTTTHGIANVNYLMLADDKVRAELAKDRDATIPAVIDEAMRLYGSVMYRFRMANADEVVAGQAIAKDDRLILLYSAANRDPVKHECPHMVDLERKPANDHLAFNKGPRNCVGINLARAEMRVSLSAVLDRMPNVRLDPDAEPPIFDGLFMRSWRPLHVVFDT